MVVTTSIYTHIKHLERCCLSSALVLYKLVTMFILIINFTIINFFKLTRMTFRMIVL